MATRSEHVPETLGVPDLAPGAGTVRARFLSIADLLVEHAEDPLAYLDRDFRLVRVNRAYARACRRPPESLAGRGLFELWPDPEGRAIFERARETGEPAVLREKALELPGPTGRGATWWDSTLTPVKDERGAVAGFVLSLREVTDKVLARNRIEESEALARSRAAELDAVLEAMPAGIVITRDRQARVAIGNGRAREMLRAAGRNVNQPPEGAPRVRILRDGVEVPLERLPLRMAAETGVDVFDQELDLVYDDGEVRHVVATAAPLRDPEGRPAGAVAALVDVTAMKDAERAAVEAERRAAARAAELEAVMDAVPATVQIAHDAEATHITGNRPSYEIMRMAPGSNVSKSGATPPTHFRVLGPDGRELSASELPMQLAAARREPVRGAQITLAYSDGTSCRLLGNATPLFDDEGNVRGAVGAFLDVTERTRGEAALRESEALYRTLADAAPDLVWMTDPAFRPVFANTRLLEFVGVGSLAELEAIAWDDVIHPEDGPRARERLERTSAEGAGLEVELRYRRHDGAWRWHLARAVPFRNDRGEVTRWVCTATDIDDRRRAEEALREEDRRKDEFLAILSHELRNPLAPILNGVALLERIGSASEPARRARDVIERQARHMARLVDDLLDITRISRGKLRLHRARLDLGGLVRRTLDDHRALLAERGISTVLTERDVPLWAHADATRLAQVVGNLLQNAAKFVNAGGHVEVTVERSGSDAVVRVRDDGIGFGGDLLPTLFRPFSQAERTLERTRGGLGLGLALSRALVEMHGGAIAARSDGPGRGAEFAVRLPLAPDRGAAEPPPGAAVPVAPRRVLVVDDNVDGATTLAELLRLRGHEVSVAHDGREGLAAARRLEPDVVVCDLGLPLLNGYDLARALRGDGGARPVLVALTGYATAHDTARSAEAGFDVHVVKPPDVDRLLALVAAAAVRPRG